MTTQGVCALDAEREKILALARVTAQASRRNGLQLGGVCCALQMLLWQ